MPWLPHRAPLLRINNGILVTGSSSSPADKRLNHSSSSIRDGDRYSSSSDRKYKDERGGGGGGQQRKEGAATKRDVSLFHLTFFYFPFVIGQGDMRRGYMLLSFYCRQFSPFSVEKIKLVRTGPDIKPV